MLELLNSLTLNASIAIVGSIVTIVLGILGYMIKVRNGSKAPLAPNPTIKALVDQHVIDIRTLHTRVSSAKDSIAVVQSEVRVLENLVRSLEKQLSDHEQRDIEDFKAVNTKSDKLMDIVIQILHDDKL